MANSKKELSKADLARRIYRRNKNKSRQNILPKLIMYAGLTPRGASTYYNNVQNEFRLELIANQK